jgi:hypothetical protein
LDCFYRLNEKGTKNRIEIAFDEVIKRRLFSFGIKEAYLENNTFRAEILSVFS